MNTLNNFRFELWASFAIAIASIVAILFIMWLYLVVKWKLDGQPWLQVPNRPK